MKNTPPLAASPILQEALDKLLARGDTDLMRAARSGDIETVTGIIGSRS
jgi:hypothetical protein